MQVKLHLFLFCCFFIFSSQLSVNGQVFSATISASTGEVCENDAEPEVVFTVTGGNVSETPYTFYYRINNGATLSVATTGSTMSSSVRAPANNERIFTYTLTGVENSLGTNVPVTGENVTVTVKKIPDTSLEAIAELDSHDGKVVFKKCSSTGTGVLFYNTTVSPGEIANYRIDWGDGSVPFSGTTWSSIEHTYYVGQYDLTYTVTGNNGCSATQIYGVYIGTNPAVGLATDGNTDICVNERELKFRISNTENNASGTVYELRIGDELSQIFNHPPPPEVSHLFTETSCGHHTADNRNSFFAKISASNPCGTSTASIEPIHVSSPPDNDIYIDAEKICVNTEVCMQKLNYPSNGDEISPTGNCSQTPKVIWKITGVNDEDVSALYTINSGRLGDDNSSESPSNWLTGTATLCVSFSEAGQYKVALKTGNKCGQSHRERIICVDKQLNPTFSLDENKGCAPLFAAVANTTEIPEDIVCVEPSYTWDVVYTATNCGESSAYSYITGDNTSENATLRFDNPGTYEIIMSVANACVARQSDSKTLVVKEKPQVAIDEIGEICQTLPETTIHPTATVENCGEGTLVYAWSFTDGTPASSTAEYPIVNYPAPGIKTVGLTVTNECGSTVAMPVSVTINELPILNDIADYEYCNGDETTLVDFEDTLAGTSYAWTNTTPSIGLPASGTGNLPVFTAINDDVNPIVATITVTPNNNDCDGPSKTFTIKVNPQPIVTFSEENQEHCSGETSEEVSLQSTTPGASIAWTAVIPTGISGAELSGTDIIPEQTLVNSTNAPLTVIYQATASLEGSGDIECSGTVYEYQITVNPTPFIDGDITVSICSMEPFEITPLDGDGNIIPANTTYTWSIPVISGGLTGGAADSDKESITGTLINTTNITQTATYTVSVQTDLCSGNVFEADVVVYPKPVVEDKADRICSGSSFSIIPVNGSNDIVPSGTTYVWSAPVSFPSGAITGGLEETAGATTISQTLTNTSDWEATLTYTVTPTSGDAGNCIGEPFQIIITVNPAPAGVITGEKDVCIGAPEPVLTFTGRNGTPPYTFSYHINNGGIINIVSDMSGIAAVTVPTSATGEYVYTLVSVSESSQYLCEQEIEEIATVNVVDPPSISTQPLSTQQICTSGNILPLSVSYNAAGTPTYQWYKNTVNSNTGGDLIPGATDPVYTPPASDFATIGKYYYYVVIEFSDSGCNEISSNTAEVDVIAEPPAVVVQPLAGQIICKDMETTDLVVSVSGGIGTDYYYQWYDEEGIIAGATTDTYTPLSDEVGIKEYYCQIIQNNIGCDVISDKATVEIVKNPVITIQPSGSVICEGEEATQLEIEYDYGVGTVSYQWYENTLNQYEGAVPVTGATQAAFSPLVDEVKTTYYYCIITFSEGNCGTLQSDITAVTVKPVPVISDDEISIGSNIPFVLIPDGTGSDIVPPGTTYTWSVVNITPANGVTGASDASTPQLSISQTLENETDQIVTVEYSVVPETDGCAGNPFTLTVHVYPPIKPNETIIHVSCFGADNGEINLNIEGGFPPYTVTWTGENGFSSTDVSISQLQPGDYVLHIEDNNGSLPFDATYTITEPEELNIATLVSTDISCYGAGDGTIVITVTGGTAPYNYAWSKDGNPFAGETNLSALQPGDYQVTVSDAHHCGPVSASVTIVEPEPLDVSLVDKTDILCNGASTGTISIHVEGGTKVPLPSGGMGYLYTWAGPNGFVSNDQDIENVYAGTYTVLVQGASCVTTATFTLNQPDEIVLDMETTPIGCHGANDATITVHVTGGVAPYTAAWSDYSSGFLLQNLSPGTYTVSVTDANNCVKTGTAAIPDIPLFAIDPEIKQISCFGEKNGSIKLNLTGGIPPISLQWDDDPTAGVERNRLSPGTYSVYISDSKACEISQTFTIIEPFPLSLSATIEHVLNCTDINTGAIDLLVMGGTVPYRFLWSNGAVTEDLVNIPPNNYLVNVTDKSGCKISGQYTVQEPAVVNVSVNVKQAFDCSTKSIIQTNTAVVTGGVPPYELTWSIGEVSGTNNEIMETSQSGMVILTVKDAMGCVTDYALNVAIPDYGIKSELIDCNQRIYAFEVQSLAQIDNTYTWSFGGEIVNGEKQTYQFPQVGTYDVTLTVTNSDCTVTFEETITVADIPVITISPEPNFCPGESVVVSAFGADNYKWSDGTVEKQLTIYSPGTYNVRGYTLAGCYADLSFNSEAYPLYGYKIQKDKEYITNVDPVVKLWTKEVPYSQYTWNMDDGNELSGNNITYKYTPAGDEEYNIQLLVNNPHGCLEQDETIIHVDNVLHPNTFTPNGDGVHDVFLAGWDLEVYNRNGVLLYRGTEGWDGTYKGRPVGSDTYFYCIYDQTKEGLKKDCGYVTVIR